MANRALRVGFLAAPLAVTLMGLVAACSDDDATPSSTVDASVDVTQPEAGQTDSSVTPDATVDSGDAGVDSTTPLPPLCTTYPNNDLMGDAAAGEGTHARYELIALRAMLSGDPSAIASCEIETGFYDFGEPPNQYECLGLQLASLAGCTVGGAAIDYGIANDNNGDQCAPAAGEAVKLGFRNPETAGTTVNDIDYLNELIRLAAISTGMAPADAARLKALLEAERNKLVLADAGAADAGFSQSQCED
jgi:hypothetical protein